MVSIFRLSCSSCCVLRPALAHSESLISLSKILGMLFQHTIWCKCLILDLVSIEMFSLHTCQCPPSWLFELCYFCSGISKFAGNLKNCNPAASIHLFPQSVFLFTTKCCTNSLANEMLRALSLFLAKHALIWLYSHQLNMHEILILQSGWYWKLFSFLISHFLFINSWTAVAAPTLILIARLGLLPYNSDWFHHFQGMKIWKIPSPIPSPNLPSSKSIILG